MKNNLKKCLILFSMGLIVTGCFARQVTDSALNLNHQNHPVTLIEYYDDECPHCHRMGTVIEQLKAAYPKLKVVYRATPVLSDESRVIASLVEAAGNQKTALHETLVSLPHVPTVDDVFDAASQLGMNREALLNHAQSAIIHQTIEHNIQLAEQATSLGTIALPLFMFSSSNKNTRHIMLIGEQPYALLSAVIKQLEE